MIKYIILIILIALTIALYRVFLKLITADRFLSLAIQWIFMFIIAWLLYLFFRKNTWLLLEWIDIKNLVFIFLAAFVLVFNWFLIMTGLRMWFNISKFTVAYAILGNVVIVLIWYFLFKDNISFLNLVWLLLAFVSIYLMSLK